MRMKVSTDYSHCDRCGTSIESNTTEHAVALALALVNRKSTTFQNRTYCRECYKNLLEPIFREMNDKMLMNIALEDDV